MRDPVKDAIAATLTLPQRRAFFTLTCRTVRDVRAMFHLLYDESAQRVLEAVAEYDREKNHEQR
jgi:hypothetical protein